MPTIGRISFSDPASSGTFPIVPDFGYGYAIDPQVVAHPFLASDSTGFKREQRFQVGSGVRRFVVRRQRLTKTDRDALITFWEARHTSGATPTFSTFTYNYPSETNSGATTAITVRFEREPLSLDYLIDRIVSVGIVLVEVPSTVTSYTVASTVDRFPTTALETALAAQQHELIPLLKVRVKESAVSDIYLSNRRVTVGGTTYEPRLIKWSGISQGIGGENDQATFSLGNADRVLTLVANDTLMRRARVTFSLYHVGSQTLINLWAGDLSDYQFDQEGTFEITASDPIYEMTLPYPTRRVSRSCWKTFNDGINCPYSTAGNGGGATSCDKTFNGTNGCQSRGMDSYFGGQYVGIQSAQIKDNTTGKWGMGRTSITATSITNQSAYGMPVPEIYTDVDLETKALIVSGREEGDFYGAVGVVGEGPISSYTRETISGSDFAKHTLDSQFNHGRESYINDSSKLSQRYYGLTESLGDTPNTTSFSVGVSGPERAAGTAFVEIKRTDPKGIQLSRPSDHEMKVWVKQGMSGWIWTNATTPTWGLLTNPIWIAVNAVMRARGIRLPSTTSTATVQSYASAIIDLQSAVTAAGFCDASLPKLVGTGYEPQFKFIGTIGDEKPLKDWIQEILNNCVGYFTFASGKLRFGLRTDTLSTNAFTTGSIVAGSLQVQSHEPTFNHITVQFANSELNWQGDTVTVYDIDHAARIGSTATPFFIKAQLNLVGTCTRSQAARIGTIRMREELGGVTETEWKSARAVRFKTTILALDVEPGEVISITHSDIPGGTAEFRVMRWALNEDFSIDIEARSVTDSMYDMAVGRVGVDVTPDPVDDFPTVLPIAGDVKSVTAGSPSLVTDSRGVQWYEVTLTYNPPDTFQVFNSVHCWTVRSGVVVDLGVFAYNGDGTTSAPGRYGTATVRLTPPVASSNESVRVYVAARSSAYDNPLIQYPNTGATPSAVVTLGPSSPIGTSAADNVTIGTIVASYSDADDLVISIPYTAPSPLGEFVGVHCWEEAVNGATWAPIDRGFFKSSPVILHLDPVTATATKRFYLASCSSTTENTLVRYTDASPTPNGTVVVSPVGRTTGQEYAPLVTGQTVTVEYDDTNVAAPMYRFRLQWTAPTSVSASQSDFGGVNVYFKYANGTIAQAATLAANDTDVRTDWWPLFAGTSAIRVYFVSTDTGSTANANSIYDAVTPYIDVSVVWPLASRGAAAKYADNVTSFAVSNARYTTNGQGQRILLIDSTWTKPSTTAALARWGGVTIYLSIPGEPKVFQLTGGELGSSITFEIAAYPSSTQTWTFYAISQDNNGNLNTDPNSPVAGTPNATLPVSPPAAGSTAQEYTSLVTGFSVTSTTYKTNASGQKSLTFTCSWTRPSDVTFAGVIVYAITPNFTNAVQLSGLETGTTLEVILSDFPTSTESWMIYAVSVDVNNRRNTYLSTTTPKAPISVNPPAVGSSGVEYTPLVTSSSFSSAQVAGSDGTKQRRVTATFTKPSDPTWGRTELRVYDGAILVETASVSSSPAVLTIPDPDSAKTYTAKLVSVDVNNRANTEQASVTPNGSLTVGSASGTFDPSRIAAGTISAAIIMTTPDLQVTGTSSGESGFTASSVRITYTSSASPLRVYDASNEVNVNCDAIRISSASAGNRYPFVYLYRGATMSGIDLYAMPTAGGGRFVLRTETSDTSAFQLDMGIVSYDRRIVCRLDSTQAYIDFRNMSLRADGVDGLSDTKTFQDYNGGSPITRTVVFRRGLCTSFS